MKHKQNRKHNNAMHLDGNYALLQNAGELCRYTGGKRKDENHFNNYCVFYYKCFFYNDEES